MLYGWDITVNVSNRLTSQTLRNDLPTHVDWRAKGFVTPVKYQVDIVQAHTHAHLPK